LAEASKAHPIKMHESKFFFTVFDLISESFRSSVDKLTIETRLQKQPARAAVGLTEIARLANLSLRLLAD
jgi:hypothetical protein